MKRSICILASLLLMAILVSGCVERKERIRSSKYTVTVQTEDWGALDPWIVRVYLAKQGSFWKGREILSVDGPYKIMSHFVSDELVALTQIDAPGPIRDLAVLFNAALPPERFLLTKGDDVLKGDTARLSVDSVQGWVITYYRSIERKKVEYLHLRELAPKYAHDASLVAVLNADSLVILGQAPDTLKLAVYWVPGQPVSTVDLLLPTKERWWFELASSDRPDRVRQH